MSKLKDVINFIKDYDGNLQEKIEDDTLDNDTDIVYAMQDL